ncbi:MAG: aminotransferase class IV [Actinomycetia bacterium]|nr:aminotransferase class IV [Actinomycetes bacterium]
MNDRAIGPVLVNGIALAASDASVSVFDIGFQRGYGCFEAMRSYGGSTFRLDAHLRRLAHSADNLRIPLPEHEELLEWCQRVERGGDGLLRIYVTGGLDSHHLGVDNVIVVFLEPLPAIPEVVRLDVIEAPWHSDGRTSELSGAKTLSYGPNLAATISARTRGFDDAALVGMGDIVLEGPTFSLAWVTGGDVYTPSLDSHILASITRQATLEVANALGIAVHTGRFDRSDLTGADEVFVMSTVKEVTPVAAIGSATFAPGPVTERLASGFADLVRAETG